MQAGRELDLKIAEIIGWKYCKSSFEQYEPSAWSDGKKYVWSGDYKPSTEIDAAWVLTDRIPQFNIRRTAENKWQIILVSRDKPIAGFIDVLRANNKPAVSMKAVTGDTPAHAICLAVLSLEEK